MGRGRKRKYDPTIPSHIDQTKLPSGIYWDKSGNGRWYVFDPHPEGGGPIRRTVAGRTARISDLHAIIEQRAGKDMRGTIGHVMAQFEKSTEFDSLAQGTREHYQKQAKVVRKFQTKLGCTLDALQVSRVTTAVVQAVVESIAKGKSESRPGANDAVPAYPSKANHILRYLRRTLAWGVRHGHCASNPANGAKQVKELGEFSMPAHDGYAAALALARAGGALKPHTAGSCPPYIWPVMEIAYLCRMRGIEVVNMTDWHETPDGLRVSRVKGSRDNVVRWTPRLRAAWSAALAIRTETLMRPKNSARPVPIRPEDRYVFVNQSGGRLSKGALDQAWQDFMRAVIERGQLPAEQRFTLHGLKHRGVTDTAGNKADKQTASGHKTPQTLDRYDHDVPIVEPAVAPEF